MLSLATRSLFTDAKLRVVNGMDLKFLWLDIERFLLENELKIDRAIKKFVLATSLDDGRIVASAGLDENVIKCVCVDKKYRGTELSLKVGTEIVKQGLEARYDDLFLYTKQENSKKFRGWGFSPLVEISGAVTFMEYNRNRLSDYLENLSRKKKEGGRVGSVVMNANPFTNGHRYLVERACRECDWVHVFLVKEDVSYFSYQDRLNLVREGLCDIANVIIHEGSDYIVSHVTFPQYFLKDDDQVNQQASAVDALMFRQYIGPALGITVRYVGTEPLDKTTRMYNRVLKKYLSESLCVQKSIQLEEIVRIKCDGKVVSASRVRELIKEHQYESVRPLVPCSTFAFIKQNFMSSDKKKDASS